jgi:HK97 family phage prohead protease
MALCAIEVAMRRSWELTPATRTTVAWTPRPILARSSDDSFRRIIRSSFGPDAIALRDEAAATTDASVLFGHFTTFHTWTRIASVIEGVFMEKLERGSFARTIREDGARVRLLYQHGKDEVLGRMVLGEITTLREDSTGGYFEASLFDGIPPLLMSGLRASAYGMSFQFSVVREDYVARPGKSASNPTGIPERTLKEVRLYEISVVTFPAYDNTSAVVGKPHPRSRKSDWRLR